jgi:hypothetical protein
MIRFHMTWVCVRLRGDDLEDLMDSLLAQFHGERQPDFAVYNAWSLRSEENELYLSPVAFNALSGMTCPGFTVLGLVEALPTGCDLLLGDQTRRHGGAIDLPVFFRPAPGPQARRRLNGMRDSR